MIPSIDLMNGKVVQLQQGKKLKLEINDFKKIARKFSVFDEVQVIDLDAAMGKGNNEKIVKKICGIVNVRVGGGIRTKEKAKKLIKYGAKKVIIGTKADKSFLKELCSEIGKEKIIVALDSFDGRIMTEGWRKESNEKIKEKIKELEKYCSEFFFTFIENEGLMKGINFQKIKKLRKLTKNKISVAGGIKSFNEIKKIQKLNAECVIGMALYTGKIDFNELIVSEINFKKLNGLVPAVVQDYKTKEVLMQGFMNEKALKKTLETGKMTYFSRTKKRLWVKGETSGNYQFVKEIRVDCDKDSLLFKIKQKGSGACHLQEKSCFKKVFL